MQSFIASNSVPQSKLKIVETDTRVSDLLNGNIDVLVDHREIKGLLETANSNYRTLSPASFGVHAMGPVYFANECAFSVPGIVKFLIAIANGWNAVYSDYSRTILIIARSTDTNGALLG